MTNIFVTSDLHIGHKKVLEFCPESRPFMSVEEMHYFMIFNWNNRISDNDIVYILGDVSFAKPQYTDAVLSQLQGYKVLISGNHDKENLKYKFFRRHFAEIHDYYELKHGNKLVCMMHYPLIEWNKSRHKNQSVMLHGHMHSRNPEQLLVARYDVGLDGTDDFSPYLLDDVLKIIDHRLI